MKKNTKVVQSLLMKIGFKFITFLLYMTTNDPHSSTKSLSVRTVAKAKYMIAHCKSISWKKYNPHKTELAKSLSAIGSSRAPISDSTRSFLAKYPSRKSLTLPNRSTASMPTSLLVSKKKKKKGMQKILNKLNAFGRCLTIVIIQDPVELSLQFQCR